MPIIEKNGMNMEIITLKSTGKYRTQLMKVAELENLNSKKNETSADKVAAIPQTREAKRQL